MGHFDHSLPDAYHHPGTVAVGSNVAGLHQHLALMDSDVVLDGQHLTIADLVALGKGRNRIRLRSQAEAKVAAGRHLVDALLKENKVVYGITTGFGKFARMVIAPDKLEELQENLIRSHSAGVGPPLSLERTRMLLALRINTLAKGHSGVSVPTLYQMIEAFNCSCE